MEFQKDREFLGKTAIFSGAASGMGLCFAKAWTDLGGNAVMCDVDGETLRVKREEIEREHPGRTAAVVTDVREYASVCHARDEAVRIFGGFFEYVLSAHSSKAAGYRIKMRAHVEILLFVRGHLLFEIVKVHPVLAVLKNERILDDAASVVEDRIEENVVDRGLYQDVLSGRRQLSDGRGDRRDHSGAEDEPVFFHR